MLTIYNKKKKRKKKKKKKQSAVQMQVSRPVYSSYYHMITPIKRVWSFLINIGSEMNFHFIRYLWNELRDFISPSLWNELCDFISPSLWRGDIKHTTSFINTVWNENSFQILFITCLTRKNARKIQFYRVVLPISLRKTRKRRSIPYDVIDELRRLSLSKCVFGALS